MKSRNTAIVLVMVFALGLAAACSSARSPAAAGTAGAVGAPAAAPRTIDSTVFVLFKPGEDRSASALWKDMLASRAIGAAAGVSAYTLKDGEFAVRLEKADIGYAPPLESLVSESAAGRLLKLEVRIRGGVWPEGGRTLEIELDAAELTEAEQPAGLAFRRAAERLGKPSGRLWIRSAALGRAGKLVYRIGTDE
jgi:hypothetical protein